MTIISFASVCIIINRIIKKKKTFILHSHGGLPSASQLELPMTINNTVPDSNEHMFEVSPSEFDDSDEDIIYEDYKHIRSF